MGNNYFAWTVERWGKRILAYGILFPILIVIFPIYKAGDLLDRAIAELTWGN